MRLGNYLIVICLILFFYNLRGQEADAKPSIISYDNMDIKNFSFLRESANNKRFVLIGESTHGVEEFGEFKMKSVEFLIDSLGFSSVLIESGFSDILKWTEKGKENYDSLIFSLFPIWHTNSYLKMFRFLKEKKVKIYGIDPQNSSKYFRDFPYEQLMKIDKNIANAFYEMDKEWSKAYSKPFSLWDSSFYATKRKAIDTYDRILKKIYEGHTNKSSDYLFLERILENRLSMARNIKISADMFHRDSIMKDNVDWLVRNILEENEKVIILSHNAHVAKEKSFDIGYLGYLMSKEYDNNIFIIGQYFESGKFVNNKRELLTMPEPVKNSFESYLGQLKNEYHIFNLHSKTIPQKVFNKKINTYYMGGAMIQNFILSENYDMIFTVKHANPPIFID